MPRSPSPLPDSLSDSFSCADARARGVSVSRLRAKDLSAPHRGVRTRPAAHDSDEPDPSPFARDRAARLALLRRVDAFSVVMHPKAFFIGRTAAVILGLPVQHPPRADLCVGVLAPARPPRAEGIAARQLSAAQVTVRTHDGRPVSSPASTWAMLAGDLDERDLVRVGDAIVRIPRGDAGRRRPERRLATLAELSAAATVPQRRHGTRLVAALALIREGSMSPLETDFRLDSVAGGLPEPELDVEIRDDRGRLLGISEVVYRPYRTIVEIEGDHHRTDRAQWHRDIEKYAAYAAVGWEVVRLTSLHVRGREPRATGIVREVLLRRGWTP